MDEEEQDSAIVCLFCNECFKTAEMVWNHCVSAHGFDLSKIKRMHGKLLSRNDRFFQLKFFRSGN